MAYKMKGHSLPGIKQSPAKKALLGKQGNLPEELKAKIKASPGKMYGKKSPAKVNEKNEEKVKETRGKDGSITKSKGGKSSTYKITSSTNNKDGSKTIVRTNEHGHSETSKQMPVTKA
tara:strand:+ start:516 stop:869 length:354 start_codon:yes stop_codon:yes gene_type:complete